MRAEDQQRVVVSILFYAAAGAAAYFILRYVVSWTLPFLLGVGIAALMRPAALALTKRTKLSERGAAGVTLLFFYLGAAALAGLFLTILLAQLYELMLKLPELYAQNIAPVLDRMAGWFYGLAARFHPGADSGLEEFSAAVSDAVRQAAVDGSTHLVSCAAGVAAKLPMLVLAAVFTIVISALTAVNYRMVGKFLCGLAPRALEPRLRELQKFLRETIWRLVRAYIIILAITFSELAAGLWLLGFEYVLPVAAAIAMLDILPLIGSGTILVPWGLFLLAAGDPPGGIGLLILFAAIGVVRNIIEPRIVGGQIGLHPIATITAMYAGLRIAGFAGLLAAPVIVLVARHFLGAGRDSAPPDALKTKA